MPTIMPKEELLGLAGYEVAPSDWLRIDQERIDRFADATDDHQFIHVDPEQAAQTPLGSTVAHGFLTLALLPRLGAATAILPEGLLMAFNYGLNKLRFPQLVRVGSEVRLHTKILDVWEKEPNRLLMRSAVTVEIKDEAKPALVAETLVMYAVAS